MTGPESLKKPLVTDAVEVAVQEKDVSGMDEINEIKVAPPEQKLVS